jgi:hypothetical protein
VISPIDDTPAFRAGIKSGDLIIKIDDSATRGMPLAKAVELMRGKPGTSVLLTVVRKDADGLLTFTLTREEINVKSVTAKMLEPGYWLPACAPVPGPHRRRRRKALKDMYKQGELKGLVLDVRSDPGGLLNQAVAVSAAFLPKDALVVYTDGRTPEARMRLTATKEHYTRRGEDFLRDLPAGVKKVPMVVLVDGGTASASEIVAGAPAGPQARRGARRPDVRQGLGADDPAALQQLRPQAHDGPLLHAVGPLDPGEGHRARHQRRRRSRLAVQTSAKRTSRITSTPGRRRLPRAARLTRRSATTSSRPEIRCRPAHRNRKRGRLLPHAWCSAPPMISSWPRR